MIFNPVALLGASTLLLNSSTGADISTFTDLGTSLLGWLITSFTTVLTFMLANPICFVWLIVSLIGVVFVFLRRTIGG